jgi:HEAT repeat protein
MSLLQRLFGPNIDKLKERQDVDGLRAVIDSDASPEVKAAAVSALADIGDEPALAAVVEAFARASGELSQAAEAALKGLGPAAGDLLAGVLGQAVGERALAALLDLDEAALEPLCTAAGEGDDAARLQALEGLLALDRRLEGDEEVRETAFRTLLAALGDGSAACRSRAAAGLESYADERAARALAAQLKDGDEAVRAACRQALAGLGAGAVPHLADALRDRNPKSQRLAAELLGELGGGDVPGEDRLDALRALLERAGRGPVEIRTAVGQALERIPADDVLGGQLELLADPERGDRDEVLELIQGLLEHAAVSPGRRAAAERQVRDLGFGEES